MKDAGLTLLGLFLRDYAERFNKLFPTPPVLNIPGLKITDETYMWIMQRIDSNQAEELTHWADARYKLHLSQGEDLPWAWYVTHPGYQGIWLSNKGVAEDLFKNYKDKGDEVFLLWLPVPVEDQSIVNNHESMDDLIL
jgi:hypothetical protein